jgi:hypothetical protein
MEKGSNSIEVAAFLSGTFLLKVFKLHINALKNMI